MERFCAVLKGNNDYSYKTEGQDFKEPFSHTSFHNTEFIYFSFSRKHGGFALYCLPKQEKDFVQLM